MKKEIAVFLVLYFLKATSVWGGGNDDCVVFNTGSISDRENIIFSNLIAKKRGIGEFRSDDSKQLDFSQSSKISPSFAERLILSGVIKEINQRHDLDVYLVTFSGEIYFFKQKGIDAILQTIRKVDPCGVFIEITTE